MEFDFFISHGWIVNEVARRRTIAESMRSLIDQCEAACPHPDWDRFRALPYDDVHDMQGWLTRPFREEPAPFPLRGLWFGLFNPVTDGRTVADIYVCGSKEFNWDDNEWAVEPAWWPEARYAESMIVSEIYRIACRQGAKGAERDAALGGGAEYPMCLGYGSFLVRELLGRVDVNLILGKSKRVGVSVGFDSGDAIVLGEFTAKGLVARAT